MSGNHSAVPIHSHSTETSGWLSAVLFVLAVLAALPFLPMVLISLADPAMRWRLLVLVGSGVLAAGVRCVAVRRRPASALMFVWLVSFGLMVAAGWSAAGWAEQSEYRSSCSYWWDNRGIAGFAGPYDTSAGKAAYLDQCIPAQRIVAAERRKDPDARCVMLEDSSGCPHYDLRDPWLALTSVIGAGGLVVAVNRWRRARADQRRLASPESRPPASSENAYLCRP